MQTRAQERSLEVNNERGLKFSLNDINLNRLKNWGDLVDLYQLAFITKLRTFRLACGKRLRDLTSQFALNWLVFLTLKGYLDFESKIGSSGEKL